MPDRGVIRQFAGIRSDTRIRMADASWCLVQDLSPGDRLLAVDGTENELIEPPAVQQGSWMLYGVSLLLREERDSVFLPPFFSPWQLLYTDSGYASLKRERGSLLNLPEKLLPLTRGLRLTLFQEAGTCSHVGSLRRMNLRTQQGVLADITGNLWQGRLYNLCLYGGSPSYWAEDLGLGMTCPVITADSVKEVSNKQLESLLPVIEAGLGAYTIQHMKFRMDDKKEG